MMLLALLVAVAPVRAHDDDEPVQLTIMVTAPTAAAGPRPTGRVVVSADERGLSLPLVRGGRPRTSTARVAPRWLAAHGPRVTIGYSGDRNYEAGGAITVTVSTSEVLTIVARPRDTVAPAIEILSPRQEARYARGEAVVAKYACRDRDDSDDPEDPDDPDERDERSVVTRCEGPIVSGGAVETTSPGSFSFTVKTEDARGNAASKTVTYRVDDYPPSPAPVSDPGPTAPAEPPAAPAAETPLAVESATAPVVTAVPSPVPESTSASSEAAPDAPPQTPAVAAPAAESTPLASSSSPAPILPEPRAGPSPVARATSAAAPTVASSQPATPGPLAQELSAYDPRSEPAKMIGILVAAFTLLQLGASGRGLALARGGGGVHSAAGGSGGGGAGESSQSSGPGFDFDYGGVDVQFLGAGFGAVALGDRSRTWSWPGTRALDALGAALPARLARRSPLLARVVADGTYLRAILGSASLLGPLGGLALGVAAIQDTGGDALAPAAVLAIAIAVLGVFDAAAGLVAVLTFAIGVLALGGVGSSADVRLMLGLSALWFVVPVLAGAARPLRRPPARDLQQSWDRAADFVIASLIGAWAVQKIVLALPGLAGVRLPIAEHADTAAVCVLAALVARLAFETIASHLYPRRLDVAEASELPEPGALQRLGASALRTTIFVFFAQIVVGNSWQLWVGAALFVAPQILTVFEERFPNSPRLFRALPSGLVELVLMLFVLSAVGALLLSTMNESSETFLANSFVLLALPGFLLSLLRLFGREGAQPQIGWGKRIAGIALLAAGILLVLGMLL